MLYVQPGHAEDIQSVNAARFDLASVIRSMWLVHHVVGMDVLVKK